MFHKHQTIPFLGLLLMATSPAGATAAESIATQINPLSADTMELSWETTPGNLYLLEVSDDLLDWSEVEGYPAEASGLKDTFNVPAGEAPRFFRVLETPAPLPLLNRQSGISVGLSGRNGLDWVVEHSFHDAAIADQVIYLRSDVEISLYHNENNSLMNRGVGLPAILGADGPDGIPDSGDEGNIHWKIDRDLQNHRYTGATSIPDWAPRFEDPFTFDTLTYDGSLPVLGTTGDNGLEWGVSPKASTERFAYGQRDAYGNEWHTLTYWDDDEPVYAAAGKNPGRQAASDGHWVYLCVNPVTPALQFKAPAPDEKFYTTPIKTYHVPKTWEQTTYLTEGVEIRFFNLSSDSRVEYRVNGGAWKQFGGSPLVAGNVVPADDTPVILEYRNGSDGPVARRELVLNPATPAPGEAHGYLLWADDAAKEVVIDRLKSVQPFARSFDILKGEHYQGLNATFPDARGGWRSGAGMASTSLNNAFLATIEGVEKQPRAAAAAKERLLRMARLEPVGFEQDINQSTPAKDYLNELSQTIQQFADAGVAYDLLAAIYRESDHPEGMTAIEEYRIRDGLAEIAKTVLQIRANTSFTIGGGDTHWGHGYEQMLGVIAAAMPSYKTPYFGVSGADFSSVNDLVDDDGKYWNPFPDQGVTWWEAAVDPLMDTPGHPNVRSPLRAEALLTDNGFWTGPNDYKADGDRYFTGPTGRRLVGLNHTGMANAEGRVELVEMDGYEAPFVTLTHVLDHLRRIRGDNSRQTSVTHYIRRRQVSGYHPLAWDPASKTYEVQPARVAGSLCAFNNQYEAASLPSVKARMSQFLTEVRRFYNFESGSYPDFIDNDRKALFNPYVLALLWDPSTIQAHQPEPNHPPIIKPLLKHVVHPGDLILKQLIIMDPDDDALTVTVSNLPAGASYDSSSRTISWIPGPSDAGVHIATVAADDGLAATVAHFPMIVKADAPAGPVPSAPTNAQAELIGNDALLTWSHPAGVDIACYIVWRDGIPATILSPEITTWTDVALPDRSHTRYHISLLSSVGAESSAAVASPGYLATN